MFNTRLNYVCVVTVNWLSRKMNQPSFLCCFGITFVSETAELFLPGLRGPKARASLGGGGGNPKKSILSECPLEPQKCNQIHQLQFKGF